MSGEKSVFDVGSLVSKPKGGQESEKDIDKAAARAGFIDRDPGAPRTKRRKARSGQIGNPKVYPEYADAFRDKAVEEGITLGKLFENMWDAYCDANRLPRPDIN